MRLVKKRIQPHIMCGVGDVARYALLPGDPDRVERIASHLDEARKVAEYRGYITYTGESMGIEITACSTGIGCPSAAIVVEELMKIGSDTFIRVGTTGSLQPHLDNGDIVIATAAVRAEGTSRNYIPVEYPAAASLDVTLALLQAAEELGIEVHPGIVMSTDAYYGGDEEAIRKYGALNVLSIEMESSLIFTLAALRGMRAGAILVVDGNLTKGTGKGEFEPGEKTGELDESVQNSIDEEIRVAVRACQILEEAQDHSLL
ncbi:MAG: nucleoside phosphorylase [Candidatus Bathyarchaeota archaeon]